MSRAVAPVFATILLVAIVTVTAGVVSVMAVEFTSTISEETTAVPGAIGASVELEATGQTLQFTNTGTETLDIDEVALKISVSDQPLAFQPTIPYFSTTGFEPGPSGPFNSASNMTWEPGQKATITVANTNEPVPTVGDSVTVEVWYEGEYVGKVTAVVD